MPAFKTVHEILDFAIGEEEAAHAFYLDLAKRVEDDALRKALAGFAEEELAHKRKLLAHRQGQGLTPTERPIRDLKLADYLVAVEPSAQMSYQDALILAMKKEKSAFRLYSDLAEQTSDEALRKTLLAIAQEEARHKLRFEIEYDDHVFTEH